MDGLGCEGRHAVSIDGMGGAGRLNWLASERDTELRGVLADECALY